MRVALIYLGRHGAGGKISVELARHLSQRWQIVAVISRYAEHRREWSTIPCITLEVDTFQTALGAFCSLIDPRRIDQLAGQIRQFTPQVMLFPMMHPWNAVLQQRLADIPSVVFVHDPQAHPDLAGWFYEKLENCSIRRASRCVVLSESLVQHLVRRGVDRERIDVVPLGPLSYRHDNRSVALSRLGKREDEIPTILFFGRIAPYKGLDVLLKAYLRLRKVMPCRLLIAGAGRLAPYRHLLKKAPDVELVHRWIAEEEIASLFIRSKLVVLPYTSASQSGVIPIAASFGLPVIATRVGGLEEQIEDGVSGWLVPPHDEQALADAMFAALGAPEEAAQRGAALRARYETYFGWERLAGLVMQSLELASGTRGSR